MHRRLLVIAFALGCAGPAPPETIGGITLDQVTSFQNVQLENGVTVPLRTGRVHFPDGAVGLLVDYVSGHPNDEGAIAAEIPFVWWELIPEVRGRGYTQGWVRALDRMPEADASFQAQGYRACLTSDGHTLWLHLDGSLEEADRAAGRSCS